MRRLCAVSVDLDEVAEYRALYGLAPRREEVGAVYRLALERIADFGGEEALPLTLFAVGRDLEQPACAGALRGLVAGGHQLENHSWGHRYDLVRAARSVIETEVRRGADAIEAVCGRRPRGFRAPGYAVCDDLFDVLESEGVAFDSSVFPSPPYYFAKALAMASLALRGRQSAAILGSPYVLGAPRRPYRLGRPWYRRAERGLLELPISTSSPVALPFIGTALTLAGPRGARLLARGCIGDELVNLELHGIDFLDVSDGLDDLRRHQPDVAIALSRKRRAISAALGVLRAAGYRFVTLGEAADIFNGIL